MVHGLCFASSAVLCVNLVLDCILQSVVCFWSQLHPLVFHMTLVWVSHSFSGEMYTTGALENFNSLGQRFPNNLHLLLESAKVSTCAILPAHDAYCFCPCLSREYTALLSRSSIISA